MHLKIPALVSGRIIRFLIIMVIGLTFPGLVNAQTCATWTSLTTATQSLRSVTYGGPTGNKLFVAVSDFGTNRVLTSPDGINWTSRVGKSGEWRSVTYGGATGNERFVAVAINGGNRVMTSPDGITWTLISPTRAGNWVSVTYGNGQFVAVGDGLGTNQIMTSPDAVTWTVQSCPLVSVKSVTYGNGTFVAVQEGGQQNELVMTSSDGISWTARTSPRANWQSVTYGGGQFVAVANSGANRVMTSPDGITWTARIAPIGATAVVYGGTTGNELYVAVGQNGSSGTNTIMTSTDGINWGSCQEGYKGFWQSVAYGGGQFVAVDYTNSSYLMTTAGPFVCPPGSVSITPSSQTITAGSSVTLTASGATSYTWSNGSTANPLEITDLTSATTLTMSVTGATGICSATATSTISVTQPIGPPLKIGSLGVVVIGPGLCPGRVGFTGSGLLFKVTGPGGYVFNQPFRVPVTDRTIMVSSIKTLGQYSACAYGYPGQPPVCQNFTVIGQACP